VSGKTRQKMPTTFAAIYQAIDLDTGLATLCNNTVAHYDGETNIISVALHGNIIVQLLEDGGVRVRHCNWVTAVTTDRIHRFMPEGWAVNKHKGTMIARNHGMWDGITEYLNPMAWTPWLYGDDSGMVPRSAD